MSTKDMQLFFILANKMFGHGDMVRIAFVIQDDEKNSEAAQRKRKQPKSTP
jgi:hypothetical protein